jgi:hypothetical protein
VSGVTEPGRGGAYEGQIMPVQNYRSID